VQHLVPKIREITKKKLVFVFSDASRPSFANLIRNVQKKEHFRRRQQLNTDLYSSMLNKLAVYRKTLPSKKHDLRKQITETL